MNRRTQMTVIIHDLESAELKAMFPQTENNVYLISPKEAIQHCIGCFGCWIKSPGKCVLKDSYNNMGAIFSQAERVIIISECCYGGYSPFVKNILDRSISYLLPFFRTKNNETHHKQRYKNTFPITTYFYGESITSQEMDIARNLAKANAINFYSQSCEVFFYKTLEQLIGVHCNENQHN